MQAVISSTGHPLDRQPCITVPTFPRLSSPQVIPGELTIVTGVPNSGKSEWIDALLANLSEMHDWTFALCSMEKKVGAVCMGHCVTS